MKCSNYISKWNLSQSTPVKVPNRTLLKKKKSYSAPKDKRCTKCRWRIFFSRNASPIPHRNRTKSGVNGHFLKQNLTELSSKSASWILPTLDSINKAQSLIFWRGGGDEVMLLRFIRRFPLKKEHISPTLPLKITHCKSEKEKAWVLQKFITTRRVQKSGT